MIYDDIDHVYIALRVVCNVLYEVIDHIIMNICAMLRMLQYVTQCMMMPFVYIAPPVCNVVHETIDYGVIDNGMNLISTSITNLLSSRLQRNPP